MSQWHFTIAVAGRGVFCRGKEEQWRALRVLGRVLAEDDHSERRVLLFCLVDDHLHLVMEGARGPVGRRVQSVSHALGQIAGTRLEPAWGKAVESRSHLINLLEYVLLQTCHHGLQGHPAAWPGSCLPDLLGARRLPGLVLALHAALPRMRIEQEALDVVGLGPMPQVLDQVPLPRLRAATEAAIALPLTGKNPDAVAGRTCLAQLATRAGATQSQIAETLQCPRRTVSSALAREPDLRLIEIVIRRLALDQLIRHAAPFVPRRRS